MCSVQCRHAVIPRSDDVQGREATGPGGQLTLIFDYAVHMLHLTPSFCQLFRLLPHFSLP